MGWMIQGWIPGRDNGFPVLQNVQTRFGAHPASCWMCTRIFVPWGTLKLLAHEVAYSATFGYDWSSTSALSLRLCGMVRDNFNFTCFFISSKFHKICFIQVLRKFVCCKPFVQYVTGIINAVVMLVAFGAIYNYTSTIRKEI